MTATQKLAASVYWTTPEKEAVIASLPGRQYQFESLEELAREAVVGGWFDDIEMPEGEELPMGADSLDDDDVDLLNECIIGAGGVDKETEAFASLVAAKGYCEERNYDVAIECALDAIEQMRRLRVALSNDDGANVAHLVVWYEKDKPQRYQLRMPDTAMHQFNSLPDLAEFVNTQELKVEPAEAAMCPVKFPDDSGKKTGHFPPDAKLWSKVQSALRG